MRKFIFILFICFGSITFAQTLSEKLGYTNELKKIVDDLVVDYISSEANVGLTIAVIDDTSEAIISYGKVSKENSSKPNEHSIFEIGAITKPIIALCALKLEEDGLINLANPITNYLPDSIENEYLKNVSIYDLITHSSGLPRSAYNQSLTITDKENPYKNYSKKHLLEYLQVFKPQLKKRKTLKEFKYSNYGYAVLGYILEEELKLSLDEILYEYLSKDLKLESTFFNLENVDSSLIVQPHTFAGNSTKFYDFGAMKASSGLHSNISDLVKIVNHYLQTEDTITNKSLEKQINTTVNRIYMAYGWHVIYRGKRYPEVYIHSGGTGGFRSYIAFIKKTKTAVVILSNSANRIDEIGVELLETISYEKY